MKSLALAGVLLAAPAGAEIRSTDADARWNLLRVLPRRDEAVAVIEPTALLAAAEASAAADRHQDAVRDFRDFLRFCSPGAACASQFERARLGLALALSRVALPEDRDDAEARESLGLLESFDIKDDRAVEARARMRALLGRKNLLVAQFYARRGKWDAALNRLETFATDYPDTVDESARAYLNRLKDAARDGGPASAARTRTAERAVMLLAATPPPPPARTAMATRASSERASIALPDPSALFLDVELRDGKPRHMSVSGETWALEAGTLGGGRSPLIGESPYVNYRRVLRSPLESAIDHRVEYQIGAVDMSARLFGDDSPSSAADRIAAVANRLGLGDAAIGIKSRLTVDDPYQSGVGLVAGAMNQYGRAFRILSGPISADLVGTVTGVFKFLQIAPNAAANATIGTRLGLPGGYDVGVFAGYTENASPLNNRLLGDLVRDAGVTPGLYLEGSPQATLSAAGPLPGLSNIRVEIGASQRWNHDTVERQAQAGVSLPVAGHPLELRATYKTESGPVIEFDRARLGAEAVVTMSPGYAAFASCEKEKISYGGVSIQNDGCLVGMKFTPAPNATATVDTVFGGRDHLEPASSRAAVALAATLGRLTAKGLELADRYARGGELSTRLDVLSHAVADLPVSDFGPVFDALANSPLSSAQKAVARDILLRTLHETDPRAIEIRRLAAERLGNLPAPGAVYELNRALVAETAAALTDPALWEGAAQAVIRREVLTAMSSLKIPLGPLGDLRITPTSAIFMANALQARPSPFAPLTAADARALQQRVLRSVAIGLGASGSDANAVAAALTGRASQALRQAVNTELLPHLDSLLADPHALAERVLSGLPPDAASRLRARLGPDLGLSGVDAAAARRIVAGLPDEAARELSTLTPDVARALTQGLAMATDILRREVNRTVLQLLLASEELDRLTVDRGLKPGDLGVRMISESLSRLDERQRNLLRERRRFAAGLIRSDLEDSAASVDHTVLDAAREMLSQRLPDVTVIVTQDLSQDGSMTWLDKDETVHLVLGKPGNSLSFQIESAVAAVARLTPAQMSSARGVRSLVNSPTK